MQANGNGQTPDTQNTQTDAAAPARQRERFTAKQQALRAGYELLDMLKGAAFPLIVMIVLSTTIILFYGFEDVAVQILAVLVGEGFLIAAYIMFGRQNGAAAYRKFKVNEAKRKLGKRDAPLMFKTGEYAAWKGFAIAFLTTLPFIILQIVKCCGEYSFVNFLLEYACGWAIAPFEVIGGVPQPCYLLAVLLPIGFMGGFYIQGRYSEQRRQEAIQRAEDDRRKGKKKNYYSENNYSGDRIVGLPQDKKGGKRK